MPVSKHPAAQTYAAELTKIANPAPNASAGDAAMKALQLSALALPVLAAGGHLASVVYGKMTAASTKANAFKAMMEAVEAHHARQYEAELRQVKPRGRNRFSNAQLPMPGLA